MFAQRPDVTMCATMEQWNSVGRWVNRGAKGIKIMKNEIKIFEQNNIRSVYDEENEKWYFSVVDLIAILTDSEKPANYWKVLKNRLKKEGSQLVTICNRLIPLFNQSMF